MKIGIGLPNAVPGASGEALVEFARRADARGFSSLGAIDRIVYDNYEPLTALAGAAAVTERIELITTVLLGPLRTNPVELAKQCLSLNALSAGRFTLGIGLGARDDDYHVSGVDLSGRGARLDAMLERILQIWEADDVGPAAGGTPGLIVGGHADASFARAARFGQGWIAGGAPPDQYAEMAAKARQAWTLADCEGEPRLLGLTYFALGETPEEDAQASLGDYYAFLGEEGAAFIVGSAAKGEEGVRRRIADFEAVGCGELIMFPASSDPAQADLLADAAGL